MLGRLLEFSVQAPDVLAAYEFYRALGYTGIEAADIYSYPYGVVSDGRIAIGLHGSHSLAPLSLTYVLPELQSHAHELRERGIAPTLERLTDERFNELAIEDPEHFPLRLLEARTFSPVSDAPRSLCGWFEELLLPVRDLARSVAFWERLDFIQVAGAPGSASLTSDDLSLTLVEGARWAGPWLRFTVEDLDATQAALADVGIGCSAQVPPGIDCTRALTLRAPEGTALLIAPG